MQEDAAGSPGLLAPQTWTYRDRPGQTFQGGKAVIAFDADCRAPGGFSEQLDRIAAAKVLQPNIDYRMGKDGHLVKLADLLPRDTAARALFKQPRQDFATALQVSYLKVADGGTALLGLVRGEAGGLATAAERRREDRERVGRGQRGGRGREGSRLDGADDERCRWAPTAPSWPPSSWA